MAIKRGCSIGLFLLICSTFTSCNFLKVNKVSEQDFIGIWKENSKSCQNNLPDCAWFEFMKDGYFKAGHIPNEYFGYTPTFSGTFDSTGKWNIELTSDPFGNHKIRLRFDPVPAMGYPIYNDILYYML